MKNYLRKLRCISALLPLSALSLQAVNAQTLPVPDHIVLIIFENHGYSTVMNASRAPHMMGWSADTNCAVFNNLTAITHPSQPNYLYLYSGSAQGNADDDIPAGQPFTTTNLGAELISHGKTFVTYSEDMPSVGFNGGSNLDYKRKHNPVANWMGTGANQVPVTTNQPWTAFPTPANYASLPTVSYVVPNQINDMHDGNYFTAITVGDTWIHANLDSFRQWTLTHNSLLIITYDEDEGLNGNKVATMFYGPMVKGGMYNNKETLINILGTIETMYGLGRAGAPFSSGLTDSPITYCWRPVPGVTAVNKVAANYAFKVAPNPAYDEITFQSDKPLTNDVMISIVDVNGRVSGKYTMNGTSLTVNTSAYVPGMYYYRVSNDSGILNEGKFIIAGH